MKRIFFPIVLLLFFSITEIFAQNDGDAIRMSQYYQFGTARATAMGGAFGSLGGDLTAVSINPAGLGIYRKGEFSITPLVYYDKTKSTYFDQNYTDFKYKFNIGNMGFVSTVNSGRDKGFVSASFSLSYNKLADFNRVTSISATNTSSSLLDEFVYYAEGSVPNDLNNNYEGLAYDVNLISEDNLDGYPVYSHDMNYRNFADSSFEWQYGQSQDKTIVTKGGINEYSAAFGANFSNILYFGMSLGINHLYYNESSIHTETDAHNDIYNLQSFDFNQYYTTSGNGFTMKMGVIVRPIDALRIGLSLHLPTFYNLSSDFSTSMISYFDDGAYPQNTYSAQSGITTTDYQVFTPWRTNLGISAILGKVAVISADYERVDYTTARIKGDLTRYDDQNKNIQNYYKVGNNLRLGGEVKLGMLYLRGGYALYGSPFKSGELNQDAKTNIFSTGFGVKSGDFSFDIAYSLASRSMYHVMYYAAYGDNNNQKPYSSNALMDQKDTRIVATLGFRF